MSFAWYFRLVSFSLTDFPCYVSKQIWRQVNISCILSIPYCPTLAGGPDIIGESEGLSYRHGSNYTCCATIDRHVLDYTSARSDFSGYTSDYLVRCINADLLNWLEYY